jgi:outer membrane immunogenic protein
VGGLFGQGRGEANANTSTVFSSTGYFATSSVPAIAAAGVQTIKPNEWLYGFDFGYNAQTGHLVFGGEYDFQSLKLSDSASTTATYPCCAPTDFTVTQSIDTTYLMTFRGRVGVTAGPVLIFGTVGLAMTDLNYQAVFTDTFASAQEDGGVDARQQALVWGAGVEVRCGRHVSIKGEYLRADFGDVSTTSTNFQAFTPPIAFPTNVFTHSSSFLLNVYRGGVNFRF